MRIAMVVDGADPDRESTELAAALTRLGHAVVHDRVRGGSGRDLAERLVARWRAAPPDVVHCRSRLAGAAVVGAARAAAIPVVHSPRPIEGVPTGTAARDVAVRADHVLATCTAELTELVAGRVPRHRISVVPHGVDSDHFTPDGEHALAGDRQRIVAVGDLDPGTGLPTAVAALCGLPDAELLLVGAPHHGDHAKELRDYARRLGVVGRVRFHGPVDRTALPAVVRSAHVALCIPWRPRFGVAAIEASSCGVAVVATNTGGLTDTVVDGVTGLLVSPHQPRALAAAIGTLLSGPALRRRMGAAGRDRVHSHYSWHRVAAETLRGYRLAGALGAVEGKLAHRR